MGLKRQLDGSGRRSTKSAIQTLERPIEPRSVLSDRNVQQIKGLQGGQS